MFVYVEIVNIFKKLIYIFFCILNIVFFCGVVEMNEDGKIIKYYLCFCRIVEFYLIEKWRFR